MVMSPFRRSVKNETKRTGGGGGRNFYDKYRPPVGTPTPFILINAEYVDANPNPEEVEIDPQTGRPKDVKQVYFKFRKHRRKLMGNAGERFVDEVCSAGNNPHNPQPCVGCAAMDAGDKSVTVGDSFAFGIVHLALYHRHPLLDKKTGGVVMRRDQQAGPVLIDTECVGGRNCNFCRVQQGQPPINDPRNPWPGYRAQDIQTVFGKRRYMELGKNHLKDLGGWDELVSSFCGHDGSQLITDGYKCPQCQSLIIDMNTDQRTNDQIRDAVAQPYPCMQCNRPQFLEEIIACETCEAANRQPLQLSMFNRVLFGMRQGEGKDSHMVLQRHMSIDEFSRSIDARLLGGRTFAQLLEDLGKPYDFAAIFAPRSAKEQADRLGLTPAPAYHQQAPAYGQGMPQQPPQGQQAFQPYPGNPQVPPQQAPGPAPFAAPMQPNFGRGNQS